MDKLVATPRERFWHAEAFIRDQWVQAQAALIPPNSWVLDAGAGASKYRAFFAHCRYQTQDFCAYRGPLVKYLQAIDYVCDITAIPLSTGCLDAILCTEVLEHVTDPMAVLAEFSRLLKPGGKLLLTAPLLSYLHMEPYHFYGGFTHQWYRYWMPKHGFEVEAITPIGGPGRTCVTFFNAFYTRWSEAEATTSSIRRVISIILRLMTKIPMHFILPRIFPKFDSWLGGEQICSGYMVSATRQVERAFDQSEALAETATHQEP